MELWFGLDSGMGFPAMELRFKVDFWTEMSSHEVTSLGGVGVWPGMEFWFGMDLRQKMISSNLLQAIKLHALIISMHRYFLGNF